MSRKSSGADKALELIKKYISVLDNISSSCIILNDKIVEVIHKRFFREFQQLGYVKGELNIPQELTTVIDTDRRLSCELAELSSYMDRHTYFMEYAGGYGYEMSQSDSLFKTFRSDMLQYAYDADSFEEFMEGVIMYNDDIEELLSFDEFKGTLENVYYCCQEYCIDAEIYSNPMIPAARKCYKKHGRSNLFRQCFQYIEDMEYMETDCLYENYETDTNWYMVYYYGQYNPYEEGYTFSLPASLYLKRLFVDIALRELNRQYHFYSTDVG